MHETTLVITMSDEAWRNCHALIGALDIDIIANIIDTYSDNEEMSIHNKQITCVNEAMYQLYSELDNNLTMEGVLHENL